MVRISVCTLGGRAVHVEVAPEQTLQDVQREAEGAMECLISHLIMPMPHAVPAEKTQTVEKANLQEGDVLQAVLMTDDDKLRAILDTLTSPDATLREDRRGEWVIINAFIITDSSAQQVRSRLYHLPSWRGGKPLLSSLYEDDVQTGVEVRFCEDGEGQAVESVEITEELDGEILSQTREKLNSLLGNQTSCRMVRLGVCTLSGLAVTVEVAPEQTLQDVQREAEGAMECLISHLIMPMPHAVPAEKAQTVEKANLQEGDVLQAVLMTDDDKLRAILDTLTSPVATLREDRRGEWVIINAFIITDSSAQQVRSRLYHLPSWRGGKPLLSSLYEDDVQTGVEVRFCEDGEGQAVESVEITEELDGEILSQTRKKLKSLLET